MALPFKYEAPVKDMEFAFEVAGIGDTRFNAIENIEQLRKDLEEPNNSMLRIGVVPFAESKLRQLYESPEHVTYDSETQTVKLPEGYEAAYKEYAELGFQSISAPEKNEGLGLPKALEAAASQFLYAANNAFELTWALTKSVFLGFEKNAADAEPGNPEGKIPTAIRNKFQTDLATGQSFGAMVLTEADSGSNLNDITTTAVKQKDGTYKVSGTKIYITGGDNEFSTIDNNGNIIHLTLAKIIDDNGKDAGISLIAIPKHPVNENGEIKPVNDYTDDDKDHKVYASRIEERKTGMPHSATVQIEYQNAQGWLVGEREKGMSAMFVLMNEARRSIGLQALGIADIAAQFSFKRATDLDDLGRRQGRATNGPESPKVERGDAIIVHPAMREKLLRQRSFVEGARALSLMTELEADLPDEGSKKWVSLVTNMQKFHFTEMGTKVADMAIQIFGGEGYVEGSEGIAKFRDDARITRIYEGTNEIQAVSLVGRQLPNLEVFENRVNELLSEFDDQKYTKNLALGLDKLIEQKKAIQDLQKTDKNAGNAAAVGFVELFSDVALGYIWAKTAQLAQEKLKDPDISFEDKLFYETKLATANFHNNVVLKERVSGSAVITLEQLEMPDAGIRRQDVSVASQYAATDLTSVKRLPNSLTIQEIAEARVARVNQDLTNASESEKRDVEKTLEQLKLDLGDGRKQNPLAQKVKLVLNRPLTKGNVIAGSPLNEFLIEQIKQL